MIYKIILFIGVAFNICAQYLLKTGMNQIGLITIKFKSISKIKVILSNPYFYGALFCYGAGFLIYAVVLSSLELNRVFPIASIVAIVFVFIVSVVLLNETVSFNKIVGIIFCCLAIYFMYK